MFRILVTYLKDFFTYLGIRLIKIKKVLIEYLKDFFTYSKNELRKVKKSLVEQENKDGFPIVLLGVIMKIVSEYFYAIAAPKGDTFSVLWSIIYFSASYASWGIVCIGCIIKYKSYLKKYLSMLVGFYFLYLVGRDLSLIGLPFNEYVVNLSDTFITSFTNIVLLIFGTYIIIWIWSRY